MTDKQTPPDWVLVEAAKRCEWGCDLAYMRSIYRDDVPYRALCDMIERYEQPPPDRKLLCAREANRLFWKSEGTGRDSHKWVAIRAIELWEEGFGK